MKWMIEKHLIFPVRRPGHASVVAQLLLALAMPSKAVSQERGAGWPEPLRALIRADDLLAHASGRADRLVDALEALAVARGKVLGPGGVTADIGYDTLYAEAAAAITAQGSSPSLLDRLQALPGMDRGAAGGVRHVASSATHAVGVDVTFLADEPAMVYARGRLNQPLSMSIVDARGRSICLKTRTEGRVYCGWQPRRNQPVRIRATYQHADATGPIEIFTN